MKLSEIKIEPIKYESLEKVEKHLSYDSNTYYKHKDRLDMQLSGNCVYLIVYDKSNPVGHVFINWLGIEKSVIGQNIESCPNIEDLFVIFNLRSQGLGSYIIKHCFKLAKQKGFNKIGLGVAIENIKAEKLYKSFNFVDSGIATYQEIWYGKNKRGDKTGPFTSLNKYLIANI